MFVFLWTTANAEFTPIYFLNCCFHRSNSWSVSLMLWHVQLFSRVEFHCFRGKMLRRNARQLCFFSCCSHCWSSSCFCVFPVHAPCQWEIFLQCCPSTFIARSRFMWGIVVLFEISFVNIYLHQRWPHMRICVSKIRSCRWCRCGAPRKRISILVSFCWFGVALKDLGPFDQNYVPCVRCFNFDLISCCHYLLFI